MDDEAPDLRAPELRAPDLRSPGLDAPGPWRREGRGPRHDRTSRRLASAIGGRRPEGARRPPERDLADLAGVSRVTVRKAVARPVADGLHDVATELGVEPG